MIFFITDGVISYNIHILHIGSSSIVKFKVSTNCHRDPDPSGLGRFQKAV